MTNLRIIEMAIKPPFKYFVQKDGYFGGGSIPAVFDRMIMFSEEDEQGYARKEFQTLEEVEKYYKEEEINE